MNEKDDFALQDFLPYLLNRAAEESSLGFQKHYKNRYGMLRSEWRVLFHLGNYGQMTAKEIGSPRQDPQDQDQPRGCQAGREALS